MPKQKSDQQKKDNSGKKKQRDDASWMDTDRVVGKAQHIINSAVNVLEEEIAAGILAAKRIENRLIDVEEIRSDPDALMNRIRRDSHEVLDLFIDSFASLTNQMNSVVEALKKETEAQANSTKKRRQAQNSQNQVTVLEPDKSVAPGESVKLVLTLYDEDIKDTRKIELRKADLIGPGSQVINKRAIKIEPKNLTLKSKEEKDITITLAMPKNSLAGHYNSLLTDTNDSNIRVLLSVEVTGKNKS